MTAPPFLVLLAAILSPMVRGAVYGLTDVYTGAGFYNAFTFQTFDDPTHGRVDYISQQDAVRARLTSSTDKSFIMRVDSSTTLVPGPGVEGRKSIRIHSNKQFATHLMVADIRHMPAGCAVWPALWENGANWPNGGEFDIIEGVNDVRPNLSSLHTSAGCVMRDSGPGSMKGTRVSTECDARKNGNQGCGVTGDSRRDFGSAFNAAGGGVFVTERSNRRFATWFFSRQDPKLPAFLTRSASAIDTDDLGTPTAVFLNSSSCNISKKFGPHRIIINTTLCGDWAGGANAWTRSGCAAQHGASCPSFVDRNPTAFKEAYWNITAIRIYTTVQPSGMELEPNVDQPEIGPQKPLGSTSFGLQGAQMPMVIPRLDGQQRLERFH